MRDRLQFNRPIKQDRSYDAVIEVTEEYRLHTALVPSARNTYIRTKTAVKTATTTFNGITDFPEAILTNFLVLAYPLLLCP